MRILDVERRPFHCIPYETVDKRGQRRTASLPFFRATVDALPEGEDAILCAGDLQGREIRNNGTCTSPRLLGQVVADELSRLHARGEAPCLNRMGVVLTGDLYIQPELNTRRGNGDVRRVWQAFSQQSAWVAGVAGNHDRFGHSPGDWGLFRREPGISFLDRDVVDVGGLRVAGVSGVIGDPGRLFRKSDEDFLASVTSLLSSAPDILVLHEGPDYESGGFAGNGQVRKLMGVARPVLSVSGHSHWDEPLRELHNGSQLLNVDGRAVLLVPAKSAAGRLR